MMSPSPVDLWYVEPERLADPDAIERCRARLGPEELTRIARVRFERPRHQRLIGWSLVRTALSRHADVAPEAWRFRRSKHGRPEIATPVVTPPLRFNLSHTAGLVACAVAETDDVGVDVEDGRRQAESLKIARRFFAPLEVEAVERAADQDRARVFFEHWTLKEAYLKARGIGMSAPLAQVVFRLARDEPPTVSFGPAIDDDGEMWQFAQLRLASHYLCAIALRRPAGSPLQVEVHQAIPGVDL